MAEENTFTQDVNTDTTPIEGVKTTASFDQATGNEKPANTGSFLDSLPESLRGEKAFQNVKDVEDLANQFLNTQKLIGKKTVGIPSGESSEEEVSKFYESLRPEEAEAYEFTEQEGRNEEVASKVKEIFHEAGLSQRQAKIVQEKYDALINEIDPVKTPEVLAQEFESRGKELLGDRYQEVMDNATKFSKDIVPPKVAEVISKMDNDSMLTVATIIDSVQKKFMNEDNSGHNGQGTGGDDKVKRRQELLNHPAFNNKLHRDHEKVYAEWKALY